MAATATRWAWLAVAAVAAWAVAGVGATWSVVIVDQVTREIGIASVTCLTGFDLKEALPVMSVGRGGGVSQSSVDSDASRRAIMKDGFEEGKSLDEIFAELETRPSHQSRQYGMVNVNDEALTFTGTSCSAYANGVTGRVGNLTYAVQGNILTGACVISAAEAAIRNSNGDIPQRLMDSLQAAKLGGGDGRCSCSSATPTRCGCPPPTFAKSGHVGFMLSARANDTDDARCDTLGCARGSYYLDLNVPDQSNDRPDPVDQLQDLFDVWRQANPKRLA